MQPTAQNRTLLFLKAVNTYYGNVQALKDVSLEIGTSELVVFIGPNGAGKTTTLRTISGIEPPRSGSIRFYGQEISGLHIEQITGLGIRYVKQTGKVFGEMTVQENLEIGGFIERDRKRVLAAMEEIYVLFPQLAERRRNLARTLSGGEQQMLAIGMTLIREPKLLLLDEPFSGLAPRLIEQISEKIIVVHRRGVAILLVEQCAATALDLGRTTGGRGYVIESGKIVLHDSAAKLLNNEKVQRAYLGW